jgi:hypothetical protein
MRQKDTAGESVVFVCANDPSCQFHLNYRCCLQQEAWQFRSHHSHSCRWSRSDHDKQLVSKAATGKVHEAKVLKVCAALSCNFHTLVHAVCPTIVAWLLGCWDVLVCCLVGGCATGMC